jgi:hypothetical protein
MEQAAHSIRDTVGVSRKVVEYHRGESIFSQGDAAETVMYIQGGREVFRGEWFRKEAVGFIAYMAHNIRVEEDLIRTLLLLARYGKQEQPDRILPKVGAYTRSSYLELRGKQDEGSPVRNS